MIGRSILKSSTQCDNQFSVKLNAEKSAKYGANNVPVPCGKCLNCKKKRVAQWSFRLMKELEVSNSAYFITLTYDTENVPITKNGFMTLVKNSKQDKELKDIESEQGEKKVERTDRSLQAFFKRLRYYESEYKLFYDKRTKKTIEVKPLRYYAAAEYGSRRRRPHYHIILFNLLSESSIKKAWANTRRENGVVVEWIPFGSIDIDPDVNVNNIDYTLKYICKEGHNKMHKNDDRQKEFALMSKGLGANFITPEIESFYNRRLDINYVINQRGHKIAMPRYYRNKMMTEETREDSAIKIKQQMEKNTREYEERLLKKGISPDKVRQAEKIGKQVRMKNYQSRNLD